MAAVVLVSVGGGCSNALVNAPTDLALAARPSIVFGESVADLLEVAATMQRIIAGAEAVRADVIDQARRLAQIAAEADHAERATSASTWSRTETAHRVVVSEVACALRLPERTAERLIDESRMLVHELPATRAALAEGAISYRHAHVILDEARSLPDAVRGDFELAVLPAAEMLTAARLRPRARAERERRHPASIERRAAACRNDRHVLLEPAHDGMAWLSAYLPAEQAAGAFARLTDIARGLLKDGDELDVGAMAEASAPSTPGTPSTPSTPSTVQVGEGGTETRTLAQLRADVLTDLLVDGAVKTSGVGAGIRATVHVTVPVERLLDASGGVESAVAPSESRSASRKAPRSLNSVSVPHAELEGYGPLDDATARTLAGHAPSFTRLLRHPETGAVLSVGRDRYSVPADLAKALRVRDRTCRFPGCGVAASRCEIDHTLDWQFGGSTDIDNLAHLCPRHHRLKHRTEWHVSQTGGGVLQWQAPSGREYVTHPDGGPPSG